MRIILASSSPRRAYIMKKLGIDFQVLPSGFKENLIDPGHYRDYGEYVIAIAENKARNVLACNSDAVVIAADSIVVFNNMIIGKPKSNNQARRVLKVLSGREHEVYTGITVMTSAKSLSDYAVTKVFFKHIHDSAIDMYIEGSGHVGKAGSYGIQDEIPGRHFINRIEGSHSNVMGLPTEKLLLMLEGFGITPRF